LYTNEGLALLKSVSCKYDMHRSTDICSYSNILDALGIVIVMRKIKTVTLRLSCISHLLFKDKDKVHLTWIKRFKFYMQVD
jgi:hypothetical protein